MTTPASLLDDLLHVTQLLAADMAAFERRHGLTGPRVHLLWQLGSGGPVRQGELATALGVTPRNVTGLVEGLLASGHVRREPHPTDRRALVVSLSEAGDRFVSELRASYEELAGQLFGGREQAALEGFGAELAEVARRLTRLVDQA